MRVASHWFQPPKPVDIADRLFSIYRCLRLRDWKQTSAVALKQHVTPGHGAHEQMFWMTPNTLRLRWNESAKRVGNGPCRQSLATGPTHFFSGRCMIAAAETQSSKLSIEGTGTG